MLVGHLEEYLSGKGLAGCSTYESFRILHRELITRALAQEEHPRDLKWTKSIAVGNEDFIKNIKQTLKSRAYGRKIHHSCDAYDLREDVSS